MSGTAVYKKAHTTRMKALATEVIAGISGPMDLTSRSIEVKLVNGNAVITLALGSGVQLGVATGEFSYDVTAANLTSLNNPTQITTTINIWNADNTLASTGTGVINVAD